LPPLAAAEIMVVDLGGTAEEVAGAIGRDGYMRAMFFASRNEQIAATAAWLAGNDGTRH
jgi:hypothetical protein